MVISNAFTNNNNNNLTSINNHQSSMNNNNNSNNQMSSLSTNDDYNYSSSRYSSLQDSESIKSAIIDSFRMHWIQAWSIMECKILDDIMIDDLSSIVNHIEQMISLLIEENININNINDMRTQTSISSLNQDIKNEQISTTSSTTPSTSISSDNNQHQPQQQHNSSIDSSTTTTLTPLLEFLTQENIFYKIYEWSEISGEWKHIMYLEQLKLYDLLISQLCQNELQTLLLLLLKEKTFIKPLLFLLNSLSLFLMDSSKTIMKNNNNNNNQNEIMINDINCLNEIEKRLVILLNSLCVIINQHNQLFNLFIINDGKRFFNDNNDTVNGFDDKMYNFDDDENDITITTNNNNNNNVCDDNIDRNELKQSRKKSSQNNYNNNNNNDQQSIMLDCDNSLINIENKNNNNYYYNDDNYDIFENFSFPLFTLLIKFLHRNNAIGQQSRDSILICLSKTQSNECLAYYIANYTDFCPLLATGLSGYFSSLPRELISAYNNNDCDDFSKNSYNNFDNNESMQYQSYQFKNYHHQFYDINNDDSESIKNIEIFLKCLDFFNAVVQISHPIIQVQLLKFTYNGFLISVIGPALHQNTLNEIITTTAYLDLFIRTTNEPKLIRIFLEFLCFEIYDNNIIINTLINRIKAKSKLSLVTLIFFKTLIDLNCEDLLYELIFKYLIRGKHMRHQELINSFDENLNENSSSSTTTTKRENSNNKQQQNQSYQSYQKNWLTMSAQKLLSTSLSYYLNNLCPNHQTSTTSDNHYNYSRMNSSSFNNKNCNKCNYDNYYNVYIDYLIDAKFEIEQCSQATKKWRNNYNDVCLLLNNIQDDNIVFSTIDKNYNDYNNYENDQQQQQQQKSTIDVDDDDDDDLIININDLIKQNSLIAKYSSSFKMKNCDYDLRLKKFINTTNNINNNNNNNSVNPNLKHLNHRSSSRVFNYMNNNKNKIPHNKIKSNDTDSFNDDTTIGPFLSILFTKFENFFDNDFITNLHLTNLLTRLCYFPHNLLLSLLFNETLIRAKNVPCFLHIIQKLSIIAQNYCDEIPEFEQIFNLAKLNLKTMSLDDLDCSLLLTTTSTNNKQNNHCSNIFHANTNTNYRSTKTNESNDQHQGSQHKAFGLLKNFFLRATNSSSSSSTTSTINRRPSNASIASSTGQIMEEISSGGIRFINQTLLKQQRELREQKQHQKNVDNFNQIVYNLIIFDEFLMELSTLLIEHSLRNIDICNQKLNG